MCVNMLPLLYIHNMQSTFLVGICSRTFGKIGQLGKISESLCQCSAMGTGWSCMPLCVICIYSVVLTSMQVMYDFKHV